MPVTAKRIDFLDQETNTGIANFNTITGGSLFNTGQDIGTSLSSNVSNLINNTLGGAKSELSNNLNALGVTKSLNDIGLNPNELINGRLSPNTDINVLNNFIDNITPTQLKPYIGSFSLTNSQKLNIASLALGHIRGIGGNNLGLGSCLNIGVNGYGNPWNILDQILASFMRALLGNSTSLINCLINEYKNKGINYSNGMPTFNQSTAFNSVGGKTITYNNLTYIQISPNQWRIKNRVNNSFIDNNIYDDLYVYTQTNSTYYANSTKQILNGLYNYILVNNIQLQYRCVGVKNVITYLPTPPTTGCVSLNKAYRLPLNLFTNLYNGSYTDPTMPIPPVNYYVDVNNDFINYLLSNSDVTLMNYDPNTIINLGV